MGRKQQTPDGDRLMAWWKAVRAWNRFRHHLAQVIEPAGPPAGEAWCRYCSLNGGKTLVLSADGYQPHFYAHAGLADVHLEVSRRLPMQVPAWLAELMVWAFLRAVAAAGLVTAVAAGAGMPVNLAEYLGLGLYMGTLIEYVGWGRGGGK